MNTFIDFYNNNKELVNFILVFVVYIVTHRQTSYAYSKKLANKFMFSAQKGSEELLLKTGTERMDWVTAEAYKLMPAWARPFVGIETFKGIIQSLFDDAKAVIVAKAPAVPVAQPAEPTQTTGQ